MRYAERTFYRYRSFDRRTLDALCSDTLHFALPSGFNDPFDSRPTLACDSTVGELRSLLEHLIQNRVAAEVDASLKRLSIKGDRIAIYAAKNAENRAREALAYIAHHATNPDYDEGPEKAEEWLLTQEIETELLKHYEHGVCCFSADYRNPLLWSHYGDQHRGICIGYTPQRDPVPRIRRVNYGGDRTIMTSLVVDAFCHKSARTKDILDRSVLLRKAEDWSYEREWRLIGKTGVQQSTLLLKEVVFGLRCPDSVKYSVVQALSSSRRIVSFFEIRETRNRYSLQREELDLGELEAYFPHIAMSGREMFPPITKKSSKRKRRASVV